MMETIQQRYDRLITADVSRTAQAMSWLEREMERRNCKFADKIVSTFLKPVFIPQSTIDQIQTVIHHILRILEKVTHLYFTDPHLKEYFYISPQAEAWIEIDQGYEKNIIIARPDSFLIGDVIRFVEFNCDSPAGMGYCDVEEEIFGESFGIVELKEFYKFAVIKRSHSLLSALLRTYREFAGSHKSPRIAIVDWRDVRTVNEFQILRDIFCAEGLEVTIADPRDLQYRNGRLEHNGFPIDLIYRRVIFRELVAAGDEVRDLFNAYKDGKVCIVNPLRSRLASNKAILSIITNPREFKHMFSEEENRIIQRHIPWTRRLIDIETHFEGNVIFLTKHVINHREGLVLKPADSYGGRDVVIGLETSQDEWEQLVQRIVAGQEDWVVQKYVDVTEMDVPVLEANAVIMKTKKYNLNPFVFGGEYAGCLARLSDKRVINVSAGGGMVPAMVYESKEGA